MKSGILACISVYLFTITLAAELSPLVEIDQGKLRGVVKEDWKGGEFYSFLSIPYARKPIGNLRFMIPVTAGKWEGILEATEDMPLCKQKNWMNEVLGQEDCLYLNVHTPELNTKNLKPVMVFIHGGGYVEGSARSDMFGAEFLMPEDVLLVTLHYRLGLFGFLNFDNPEVGVFGNMAFKDQNMALRWVQKNIEKFGGDPKSVTIFGESAGGSSVHLHVLSPMSQGLFHRAIAMSGTALHPWAVNGQRNTGAAAAKLLGYEGTTELKMLPFLQEATIEDILKVQENATMMLPISEKAIAGAIVETIKDDLSFLPDTPEALLAAKQYNEVPVMFGVTDRELIIVDTLSLANTGKVADVPIEAAIPHTLNVKDDKTKAEVVNKMRGFYYTDKDSSDRSGVIDHIGDAWIYWGAHRSVVEHSKRSYKNLYLYMISADTELNYCKRLHPVTAKYPGTSHMDEFGYIFKNKFTPDIKPNSKEEKTIQNIVKLFTNFAKYGNPTPKQDEFNLVWKPVEEGALNFLNIGTDSLKLDQNMYSERMAFWETLYQDYGGANTKVHTEL